MSIRRDAYPLFQNISNATGENNVSAKICLALQSGGGGGSAPVGVKGMSTSDVQKQYKTKTFDKNSLKMLSGLTSLCLRQKQKPKNINGLTFLQPLLKQTIQKILSLAYLSFT